MHHRQAGVGKVINSWVKLSNLVSGGRQSDVNTLEEQANQFALRKEKICSLLKGSHGVKVSISDAFLVYSGQGTAAHCNLRDEEQTGVDESCERADDKRQSFVR